VGESMLAYRERGKMLDTFPGALEMMLSQNSSRACWGGFSFSGGPGGGDPALETGREPKRDILGCGVVL